MPAPFYVLPLGEVGSLAGVTTYLFNADTRDTVAEAALSLSEDVDGNVIVQDLPETDEPWSLLWIYAGQAGVHRFGKLTNPAGLVLPILDVGVTVGDLAAVFYVSGERVASAPALAPLSPAGYYLSGLVAPASGEVRVYYEHPAGLRQVVTYETSLVSVPSAATTLERQALGKYFRRGFLGAAYDQTDLCPIALPGLSFDPEKAADVAPFTVAQVRDQVGYVSLTLREVDAFSGDVAGGLVGGVMTSVWYTLTRCRFAIRVPGTSDQSLTETYQEKILELALGLSILESGPPEIHLRQLVRYPPRLWGDTYDSTWRERSLDVLIRRRERRAHAGAQEVA